MKKLATTGFGVRFDRTAGRYRLDSTTFLPPIQLTLEESLALIVLCEDVAGREQVAHLGAATGALAKVESQLPPALRQGLQEVMDHVQVRLARAAGGEDRRAFDAIRRAIASSSVLRCRYKSAKPGDSTRLFEFEPYTLWYGVRAWYAIGLHRKRAEVLALKLRRFQLVEPTGESFTRPENFTVEDYLSNAWQMIPGERDYDIEILFDASFAETVCDTLWHRTQRVTRHADGSATVHFTVSGLDEITWWVLSMGAHCRVIRPRELRRRVRAEAQAAARQYRAS
jgi:predicted DNA-binding transcriptional regulator YafY